MHVNPMLLRILLTLALCLCTAAPCLAGGTPFSMEVVSRWGGPINAVEVIGNTAYIGSGSRMVILNVANPANITEIGSIDLVVPVMDIAIQGQMAYVTTVAESPPACVSSYGFCAVDISNPAHPTLLSYDLDALGVLQPRDVEVYGNTAYVTGNTGGINVFDITVPSDIDFIDQLESLIPMAGFSPRCIQIVGNLLYIADDQARVLRIYNLQPDPLHPVQLGQAAYPDAISYTPTGIDVSGGLAAISSDQTDGGVVMFFDVSNSANPVFRSSHHFTGTAATGVALHGNYAFVTDYAGVVDPGVWFISQGLVILNIQDPSNPFVASSLKTHGAVRGVRTIGNRAYVTDDGEGVIIFDITNPTNPQRLGNYHSPAWMRDTLKDGDRLYIADGWNGFTILDVSNPHATPQVLGVYQTPNLPVGLNMRIDHQAIAIHGDHIYLMSRWFGISVVDVSNPASPQLVIVIPNENIVIGGTSYVTVGIELETTGDVLHVSYQPHCPTTCFMPPTGCLCGVPPFWLFKNYNINDPTQINLIAQALIPGGSNAAPTRLVINPQGVGFGPNDDDVSVFDTGANDRPPFSSPSPIGFNPPAVCLGVALTGTTLLLASNLPTFAGISEGGLHIQDVSNPSSPVQLAFVKFDTPGIQLSTAWDVAAQNGRAYVFGRAKPNPSCPNTSNTYVLALDVSKPASPVLLDYLVVSSDANSSSSFVNRGVLLLEEPYLYAAGGNHSDFMPYRTSDGLSIIKINGIPVPCPADINNSGAVDVDDLIAVILGWGPCGKSCPADIDDSGEVDVDDLVAVILGWGPCP